MPRRVLELATLSHKDTAKGKKHPPIGGISIPKPLVPWAVYLWHKRPASDSQGKITTSIWKGLALISHLVCRQLIVKIENRE